MHLGQQEFDRILFYEHAHKNFKAVYAKNPHDDDNLISWARVLIELWQFQTRSDSIKFIKDVVSMLEKALEFNPKKHDAIWSLGNAKTSLAFITKDLEDAKPYFTRAMQCFQQALEEVFISTWLF
ncbi:Mitochondrial import receptor subunit TOM20 [Platanthera guangdongensis]|uniref:Mitochondrial import receptor subunit TOM20 n=1 Tax=Platanthera guangdongensis TaxID=2320717 RepID=A0ABR2LX70_9ASPA